MNPIRSYQDFQKFMEYVDYNGKPIPVLFIRPDVLLTLKHCYPFIGELFEYYNQRTGDDIVFFVPGYSHYPATSFHEVFPSYPCRNDDEIAFTYQDRPTRQTHHVYFNHHDFVDFVKIIERESPGFSYSGGTELILPTYVPGNEIQCGNLDFSTLPQHRYNLSTLFFHYSDSHRAFSLVREFLELVIHQLVYNYTTDEFYRNVDEIYIHLLEHRD